MNRYPGYRLGSSARGGEASTESQSQPGASSVSYEGATKRYGSSTPAVDHLTLEVPAGEICVLVGPSGCGKTTAMRMVNRTVEMTEGDILVGGESVRDRDPASCGGRSAT